ncbi:hypothetical protein A3J43_00380 [Candidatus Uhrbacteria bacterium RIFCSPHIGHO2_12_FULL_54_23]|uniref:Nucleotidyltransferase n=1 Tax=Candidatus Uhrbacteria bacterium RIFCSPHIGHO2_12_FULL_54_23 TaxID=1802397 RepID=A0A1F7UI03_9BACT|nr:MAG: hypothetical protein A3J43_00380 [Candidatus Uhrbacteria bacterium RIFCSPHIGHO2_12_FULL_54_23]
MTKQEAVLRQMSRAVVRLGDALAQEETEFMRDSAIQRFEFTLDLAWKAVKALLQGKGIACYSPKDCFREAYQQGWIDYDEYWLEMVDLRNLTVHTYKDELARKVYAELPQCLTHLQSLLKSLEHEIQKPPSAANA